MKSSATAVPALPAGHILHATFLKTIQDQLEKFVEEILVKKFTAQRVRLSAEERRRLHGCVLSADFSDFKLQRSRPITIKWTAADSRRLNRAHARVVARLPKLMRTIKTEEAERLIRSLKRRWQQQAAYEDSLRHGFRRRLYRRWRRPLDGLARMVTIAREFSMLIGGPLQTSRTHSNQHLIAVLVRLHARGCQVAEEIVVLLREGLADGAMARWRTLHEIAVVAMFIRDKGDSVAERYLQHEQIENYKGLVQYQKHAKRLKLRPYTAREVTEITRVRNDLVVRFGTGFGSDYGWAGKTPDDRPTFDRLEEAIAPHWRPYYRLASHNVHANPKGILRKMGLMPTEDILLTGPSNYGLAGPGQNAALTLALLSVALGTIEPTVDSIVLLHVMGKLSREVGSDFVDAQRGLHARHVAVSARRGRDHQKPRTSAGRDRRSGRR